jgi:hypothetical protein
MIPQLRGTLRSAPDACLGADREPSSAPRAPIAPSRRRRRQFMLTGRRPIRSRCCPSRPAGLSLPAFTGQGVGLLPDPQRGRGNASLVVQIPVPLPARAPTPGCASEWTGWGGIRSLLSLLLAPLIAVLHGKLANTGHIGIAALGAAAVRCPSWPNWRRLRCACVDIPLQRGPQFGPRAWTRRAQRDPPPSWAR